MRSAAGHDRLIVEKRHDPYADWGKQPRDTMCPTCSAVFTNGRWTWGDPPPDIHGAVCPACRRIADEYPAGHIELTGAFLERHRDEITNLIHNVEDLEKAEHPLERIMKITVGDKQTIVATTGVHVARRIGEAISHAYQGDFSFAYCDAEASIRVRWQRKE